MLLLGDGSHDNEALSHLFLVCVGLRDLGERELAGGVHSQRVVDRACLLVLRDDQVV